MDLREKAKRANSVFQGNKKGFISCEYRNDNGNESLVYSFSDKNSAHSFLLEQQINFESRKDVRIFINNNFQVIEEHLNK